MRSNDDEWYRRSAREIDDSRGYITAYAHKDHHVSLKVCAGVGLTFWMPKDEHYSILLGEVPPE